MLYQPTSYIIDMQPTGNIYMQIKYIPLLPAVSVQEVVGCLYSVCERKVVQEWLPIKNLRHQQ